jgi:hypothetical protein
MILGQWGTMGESGFGKYQPISKTTVVSNVGGVVTLDCAVGAVDWWGGDHSAVWVTNWLRNTVTGGFVASEEIKWREMGVKKVVAQQPPPSRRRAQKQLLADQTAPWGQFGWSQTKPYVLSCVLACGM